jgi:hypothetical protein
VIVLVVRIRQLQGGLGSSAIKYMSVGSNSAGGDGENGLKATFN